MTYIDEAIIKVVKHFFGMGVHYLRQHLNRSGTWQMLRMVKYDGRKMKISGSSNQISRFEQWFLQMET